jgi:hypothetical protein
MCIAGVTVNDKANLLKGVFYKFFSNHLLTLEHETSCVEKYEMYSKFMLCPGNKNSNHNLKISFRLSFDISNISFLTPP